MSPYIAETNSILPGCSTELVKAGHLPSNDAHMFLSLLGCGFQSLSNMSFVPLALSVSRLPRSRTKISNYIQRYFTVSQYGTILVINEQ